MTIFDCIYLLEVAEHILRNLPSPRYELSAVCVVTSDFLGKPKRDRVLLARAFVTAKRRAISAYRFETDRKRWPYITEEDIADEASRLVDARVYGFCAWLLLQPTLDE